MWKWFDRFYDATKIVHHNLPKVYTSLGRLVFVIFICRQPYPFLAFFWSVSQSVDLPIPQPCHVISGKAVVITLQMTDLWAPISFLESLCRVAENTSFWIVQRAPYLRYAIDGQRCLHWFEHSFKSKLSINRPLCYPPPGLARLVIHQTNYSTRRGDLTSSLDPDTEPVISNVVHEGFTSERTHRIAITYMLCGVMENTLEKEGQDMVAMLSNGRVEQVSAGRKHSTTFYTASFPPSSGFSDNGL